MLQTVKEVLVRFYEGFELYDKTYQVQDTSWAGLIAGLLAEE